MPEQTIRRPVPQDDRHRCRYRGRVDELEDVLHEILDNLERAELVEGSDSVRRARDLAMEVLA